MTKTKWQKWRATPLLSFALASTSAAELELVFEASCQIQMNTSTNLRLALNSSKDGVFLNKKRHLRQM